ncbi:MAG: response regulator, partial [Myxococcota bacterium]|nr:response regulator [Myxococcota bacterium]
PSQEPRPAPAPPARTVQRPQAVGIVASTGGPQALQRVLSALPGSFPAPLLIVQHIAEGFERGLADWLGTQCALPVKVAQDGEAPLPGHAYLAPNGTHLVLSRGLLRLQPGPAVRGFCPSGTVLLGSLARELGPAASGVILTGMGEDGVAGLQLIRAASGQTLAQGPESSVVYGMPRVALESGAAERAVELEDLADALLAQLSHTGVPGRRRRLLLVDDSETVLSLERHLLGRDYELFVARDGQEAIDVALRHQPDGILLDYRMPGMTGAAALRWMRATPELSAVPVIMVTSEDSPEILEECRRAGCQTIVAKPIDARRLLAAVSQFVKSQGGNG